MTYGLQKAALEAESKHAVEPRAVREPSAEYGSQNDAADLL